MAKSKTERVTVTKCSSKEEANQELVKGLLSNEPMSYQFLVTTLLSSPYNLFPGEIYDALNRLNEKGLLKVNKFRPSVLHESRVDIELILVN